jgi:hypothetical protein
MNSSRQDAAPTGITVFLTWQFLLEHHSQALLCFATISVDEI